PPPPGAGGNGRGPGAKPAPLPAPVATVTISIGVAWQAPGEDGDPRGLVERADQALYRAKHAGRNCVRGDTETKEEQSGRRA
ncbi:MAG TPA: GGDEF domain-containing protein, partial [Stenotrophomonas maltophilia]|nr:GGDEF domain-containing protein [Stenotrophomonas maltophilia]